VSELYPFGLAEEQEDRASRLHQESVIFDGCFLPGNLENPEQTTEFVEGGITGGNVTVADVRHNFVQAMESVLKYRKIVRDQPERFMLGTTRLRVLEAKRLGRLAIVLGFQDAKPVEDNLEHLEAFYALGVRITQLTYNTQNFVGSGCIERHYGGLTLFGRDLVQEMNRLGIAIDLSHCSDETSTDAIEMSEKPVLFTHANARTVCPAYGRNKPDELIKALAAKGGVIGVIFRPNFVKRDSEHRPLPCTVEDVLDHVDHVVNLVGVDYVGYGSDVFSRLQIPGVRMSPWLLPFRQRRPDVFGRSEVWSTVKGLENGREFFNLTRGLVARGYSDEDIRKILGGNFLRALGAAWNEVKVPTVSVV